MAHVTLHFSVGVALATACMARRILAAWRNDRPVAGLLARWLLVSWGVGVYASVPSLLRQAGLADAVCDGWWMNVFAGYPLIKRVFRFGGMPLGALALTCVAGGQYLVLVLAVRRTLRIGSHSDVELTHQEGVV